MKRRANGLRHKPRVTLRDLAKDLHLSISTVSRAFHKADLRRVADGAQVDARIAWHPLFRWTLSSARAS